MKSAPIASPASSVGSQLDPQLVRHHHGERELEQVVVAGAEELGPEERAESALAEQRELVRMGGRVVRFQSCSLRARNRPRIYLMTSTGPPRRAAVQPREDRVDRDGFDAVAEALLVRVVVERDVRRRHARAEALQRRQVQGRRLVALQTQPGLRAVARRGGRILRGRERLDRPLVRLLVADAPRVGDHVVGRRVEARDPGVVAQRRQQARLHVGLQHDDRRFVAVEVVEEELAEALPIDRGLRRAAGVELVDDAPDGGRALAVAVGEAEVRVAQPVLGQVLPGPRQHDDLGARRREARRRCAGPGSASARPRSRSAGAPRSCGRPARRPAAASSATASA